MKSYVFSLSIAYVVISIAYVVSNCLNQYQYQ